VAQGMWVNVGLYIGLGGFAVRGLYYHKENHNIYSGDQIIGKLTTNDINTYKKMHKFMKD
jgi:hypothetical protein